MIRKIKQNYEMNRIITTSAVQTQALGEKLAAHLLPGDIVLLFGLMGAGKSELARGIAKGLGVRETVISPTFPILQAYHSGVIPFYHFDWYRIRDAEELYELSMEEYLGGDGIAVVEWPERAEEVIPAVHFQITITILEDETRGILLVPIGGFHPFVEWP